MKCVYGEGSFEMKICAICAARIVAYVIILSSNYGAEGLAVVVAIS